MASEAEREKGESAAINRPAFPKMINLPVRQKFETQPLESRPFRKLRFYDIAWDIDSIEELAEIGFVTKLRGAPRALDFS